MRNLISIPGWRTKRKIVVFQSDDWGSIRMSSNRSYKRLLKAGVSVDKDPYNRFDAIASEEDLSALFDTLRKVKDKNNKHPVITANTIVANPDFEKIESCNFEEYHYELFTETLKRYSYKHRNVFQVWKQGIEDGLFDPQFHGREHVNISMWLDALRRKEKDLSLAFQEGVFGIPITSNSVKRHNYMASFDCEDEGHFEMVKDIVKDGLNIFYNLFDFRPKSIIAPCYVWPTDLVSALSTFNIQGIQGIHFQYEPKFKKPNYRKVFHYMGESNKMGQRHLIRNAFFEPAIYPKEDCLSVILSRMKIAFDWQKPVIIGSHRLNFIGFLNEENRTINLAKLETLFKVMLKKWPDIEFMSTTQLLDIMLDC